jgi:hypothetical protein
VVISHLQVELRPGAGPTAPNNGERFNVRRTSRLRSHIPSNYFALKKDEVNWQ